MSLNGSEKRTDVGIEEPLGESPDGHKKNRVKLLGVFYGGSGGTRTPDQTVMSGQL